MKYQHQTWGIIMMSLFVSAGAFAKVTYEDALADNAEAKAKHEKWFAEYSKPENNKPLEVGTIQSPNEWRTIFSGSTTGSVQIPADATEVYVVSTEGARMFPASSASYSLGSVESSAYSQWGHVCVTARATGTYSNHVVRGQEQSASKRCQISDSNKKRLTATAKFEIKSVMIK
ncbi:hypothetical protein [Vibrio maritimus]|uniref:hypothetical protein n=1 Tax=Vibrio maritimus TaxID=990268 RepID=UPI001F2DEDD5|nr:hypothetical protein [Vibrio maritimus]